MPDKGVFVAAVWSRPKKVPSMKIPSSVLGRLQVPPLPTAVNPFRLSDVSVLNKLFIEAGFEDVKTEAVSVLYHFDSAEEYLDFAYETSGSFKSRITNAAAFLSDEKQDKIRRGILDEARSFVDSKGQLSLTNETLLREQDAEACVESICCPSHNFSSCIPPSFSCLPTRVWSGRIVKTALNC